MIVVVVVDDGPPASARLIHLYTGHESFYTWKCLPWASMRTVVASVTIVALYLQHQIFAQ